ncbi:MAG: purine-nucleoside phosphorylase [Chloroflexota bacterium]
MGTTITAAEIADATADIRSKTTYHPKIGIVLGSGLSSLADTVEQPVSLPTNEIPHWPVSTVAGHSGRLVFGYLEGREVLVLQGRSHFYEGYDMSQLALPPRVMHALGVKTLILTNAAGGLNPSFQAGDLMVIRDHLNFPGMAGHNPLYGPNDNSLGPRFPDMTDAYDPELRTLAHQAARNAGFEMQEGVYAYVAGPSFETPAELRFLQFAGGDAVGMSTAPSTVTARHMGMRVLGISTISNMALPDPVPGTQQSHEDVLAAGQRAVPRLIEVIRGVVRELG